MSYICTMNTWIRYANDRNICTRNIYAKNIYAKKAFIEDIEPKTLIKLGINYDYFLSSIGLIIALTKKMSY